MRQLSVTALIVATAALNDPLGAKLYESVKAKDRGGAYDGWRSA
jgi:hypothetical protein